MTRPHTNKRGTIMASTQTFYDIILKSEDVPGAYINTDELENCGNVQFKRWLECRGLKQSGNRLDLLTRYVFTFRVPLSFV